MNPVTDRFAASPRRMRFRRRWLRIHRFLGKSILGMLALTSLLGSLLVFHRDIDATLHPELFTSAPAGGRLMLSPSEIVSLAVQNDPGIKPQRLYPPTDSQGVYVLHHACDPALGEFGIRYADAYDGSFKGQRYWGDYFWSFIYRLHSTLFMGETGEKLLGIVAIAALISMLSGMYLWYPRHESWRQRFDISSQAAPLRRMRNLHGILGIFAITMTGTSCITGLHLVYPQTMKMIVTAGAQKPVNAAPPAQSDVLKPIPLDRAISIARRTFDHDPLVRISFPSTGNPSYMLMFRDVNDPARTKGSNVAILDANTGEVRQIKQWKTMSAGERWLARQLPLHNGEMGGVGTRLMMALGGLTLTALFITGLWQWRIRLRGN